MTPTLVKLSPHRSKNHRHPEPDRDRVAGLGIGNARRLNRKTNLRPWTRTRKFPLSLDVARHRATLGELTGGEVDTVAGRDGRAFFLCAAPRNSCLQRGARQSATAQRVCGHFRFDMPAMIWFKDTEDCSCESSTSRDTAGKKIEEIEGKPSSEITPRSGATLRGDLEVIHSGGPRWGSWRRSETGRGKDLDPDRQGPYCAQDGTVIGIVVMAQDITSRKRGGRGVAARQPSEPGRCSRIAHFGSWSCTWQAAARQADALCWSDENVPHRGL